MATLVTTLSDNLQGMLTKIGRAGIRHPATLQKTLLGHEIKTTFSYDVDDDEVTVTLDLVGLHEWPYADEPELVFDDRSLA